MFDKPSKVLGLFSWASFFGLSWLLVGKPDTRDTFTILFLIIFFVLAICASALSYNKK